jgi:hypothetical protein
VDLQCPFLKSNRSALHFTKGEIKKYTKDYIRLNRTCPDSKPTTKGSSPPMTWVDRFLTEILVESNIPFAGAYTVVYRRLSESKSTIHPRAKHMLL